MGISIWQLLIVLGIVVLLFGTKKLRNLGGDLGAAVKSFKGAIKNEESTTEKRIDESGDDSSDENDGDVIDAEVESRDKKNT